jgi:hypothetical protein
MSLVEYCQRVHTNLQRFDLAEQRRALAALNITVVWHPDMPLEITGSIPVEIAYSTVNCTPCRVD